jgi:hypothetical protein
MKIEVLNTQWAHDGGVLQGGVHEIEDPSQQLLEQAALAESVGSIKVTASKDERATMKAALEPDSESLKKLAQAQKESTWHEGNLGDYIAVKQAVLDRDADEDDEFALSDESRAGLEAGVAQAQAILKVLQGQEKKDYDAAVREVLNG